MAHINTHTLTVELVNVPTEMLLKAFNHVCRRSKISEIGETTDGKRFNDFELSLDGTQSNTQLYMHI